MGLIATIIIIIVAVQIFMLVENIRVIEVARAGRVDKFTCRYNVSRIEKNEKVKDLKSFVVRGESMRDFEIHNGNIVYVKTFRTIEEKSAITTHPVLMFTIDGIGERQSRYKLRKFVDYVTNPQNTDWGKFYDSHKDRLSKISKSEFMAMCQTKVEKLKLCNGSFPVDTNTLYILSETHEDKYLYSLHPIDSLYGKVCYAA